MPASTSARSAASSRAGRGESADDISYSHSKKLSIPSIINHASSDARDDDRLARAASKWSTFMYDATYFVYARYSLAVALGKDIEGSLSDPLRLAEPLLTQNEMDMYKAWKREPRRAMPQVSSWRDLRVGLNSTTQAQIARWDDLTEALNILYNRNNLSRENAKAWVERYKRAMPLLIAVKKIEQVRHDIEGGKRGGSARRHVHELLACRKVISELGKYRIEANAITRETNKYIAEREEDYVKKIARYDRESPRRAETAKEIFVDRENTWKKLVRLRVERVEKGGRSAKQNAELNSLEKAVKDRMAVLESRLRQERRRNRD